MRIVQSTVGALALCCVSLAGTSPATAWGCFAHGHGTAQGWSFKYESIRDAQRWALRSCLARPHARGCRITSCSPNADSNAYWGQ